MKTTPASKSDLEACERRPKLFASIDYEWCRMLEPHKRRVIRSRTDLSGRTVLVLACDFHEGRDIQHALQHAGARVIGPFQDVRAALRAVASRALSCAVIDSALGAESYLRMASVLSDRGIAFVAVDANSENNLPAHLAATAQMDKPADCQSLPGLIARVATRWV